MSKKDTILERMEILRLSNAESNKVTKEALQTALLWLMEKKPFSEISVTEIVNKAGVSRTAYYRNYDAKEDILNSFLADTVAQILAAMEKKPTTLSDYEYWLTMFNDIKPYAKTIKLLIDANFGENIQDGMYEMVIKDYKNVTPKDKYVERFWCSAVYGVLKQWLIDGMKEMPEAMAEICCKYND